MENLVTGFVVGTIGIVGLFLLGVACDLRSKLDSDGRVTIGLMSLVLIIFSLIFIARMLYLILWHPA